MTGMRAVAYEVGGDRIGVLPDVLDLSVTVPFNDLPTVSLKYPEGDWGVRGSLLDGEIEVSIEMSVGENDWFEIPGGRFMAQSVEQNPLSDGTSARTLKAVHIGHMLDEALVWEVPEAAKDSDGKWNFLSATAGEILRTLWDAAQARGWGRGLTLDVDTARDSANAQWKDVATIAFGANVTLASVVQALEQLDMIDWQWQGRNLRVYNSGGSLNQNREYKITWPLAVGTTDAPETISWQDRCTDVLVKGEGGRYWRIHSKVAPTGLRRIEKVVEAGGVELEATAERVASSTLWRGAEPSQQIKREWNADSGAMIPFRDYQLGDWMRVQRTDTQFERLRAVGISLTYDEKGLRGHTTFGTYIEEGLARMAKKLKGITGGASATTTRPAPDERKYRTAAAPKGVVASGDAVINDDGFAVAVMGVSFQKVTQDTKGTAVNVSGYDVWWRRKDGKSNPSGIRTFWASDLPQGGVATVHVAPLEVYGLYEVAVRAIEGNNYGVWSPTIEVRMPGDVTPPPAPTRPVVSQTLGVLDVVWDGKGPHGVNMPADYDHTDVSITAPGDTPVVVTRMSKPVQRVSVAGLEMREWEVRLRTVDRSGNASDWSEPSSITLEAAIDTGKIISDIERKLSSGEALQRAAREETLKNMTQLTEAMTQVATALVDTSPYPPDAGKIDSTIWVSPDARTFVLRKKGQ